MLKDRFFYPIALALIAGIIWVALSRAETSNVISADVCKLGYTIEGEDLICLLYTSPSPRDKRQSRMPSSA